ncbi:hypothetical protein EV128_117143 [Rhizobium azibense]|nr:hypothetical protein EV128_117143 [Rhizobium azibense]
MFAVVAVYRGNGNSYARAYKHTDPVDGKRIFERPDQGFGQTLCFSGLVVTGLNDGKFIACEPVGGLTVAENGLDPFRRHLEHDIAGAMAKGVVDRLEVIEIDLHQCKLVPGKHREIRLKVAAELATVGQSRQCVMPGLMKKQSSICISMRHLRTSRLVSRLDDAESPFRAEKEKIAPLIGRARFNRNIARDAAGKHGLDKRFAVGVEQLWIYLPKSRVGRGHDSIGLRNLCRAFYQS